MRATAAANRSRFGVWPDLMRREFRIAGAVGGLCDVAAIGGGVEREGPVRNACLLRDDRRAVAIDGDGRDLAVVMRNATQKSPGAFAGDAGDQGRGRHVIHGREEFGKRGAFDFGGARLAAC